ncbi:MAG: LysM peptidoglycan-binding domain-containing protein [Alphaproteobacteria bacterium]|nr:LysM peptidoglycan-binding domain-containing protein [Alphaproteobacteria bacterium]
MRFLIYIVIGAGGALAALALAFVLLGEPDVETVTPQPASETAGVTASASDDATASSTATAPTTAGDDGANGAGADEDTGAAESAETDAAASDAASALAIDLAQVKPDGAAVFAGSSAPNARIVVYEGDILLGETVADANGEWVVILEKNLGPGDHLVSIGSTDASGNATVADIMLGIQVSENKDERPLVALLPQTEGMPPQLLQSPDDKDDDGTIASASADADLPPALAPRSLAWKDGGALVVSGVSRGGVRVSARANDFDFGAGQVETDGNWQVAGKVNMDVASRVMKFTLHDGDGNAVATYILPVATRDLSRGLDGSRMVVVQRGDALWRIAYSSYGEGVRFVDIVRRNAGAISDPDLIFPNQIFTIPD